MEIASEYLEADDLLIIVWHGLISGGDWEQFVVQRLADDPTWPPGKRRLADLTTLDPSNLSEADVEAVIPHYRDRVQNLVGSRQALVATEGWELARMFERRIDQLGATTIVFNDVEAASAWLVIDPASARRVIDRLRAGLREP